MSQFHTEGDSLDLPKGTAYAAGTIVQVGGHAGIVNADFAATEQATARITGTVIIGTLGTFTDGDTVEYRIAQGDATANPLGDFEMGTAVGTNASAGDIQVLLNGQL